MEFSDDSFIWSDASKDSDTMEFDIKQEVSDNNKEDSLVEDRSHKQKNKTKKRKYEESTELNATMDIKPKLIKSEPDSDFDSPRKKKKKKLKEETQESDFDDSYLNYKVKQEQVSFLEPAPVKTKNKKKLKKNSESFISEDIENTSQEVDTDTSKPTNGSQIDDESNSLGEEVVEKKKKKKSKKHASKCNDTIAQNDDLHNSEDQLQAKKKLKRKKHDREINSKSFDGSEDSQIEEISCINSSTLNNNFIDDDQIKESSNGDINFESTKIELKTDYLDTSKKKSSKQVPKILERLRFEDEDSIDSVPKENEEVNLSKHLKSFFNANKKLSLITPKDQTESIITEDDEIWIIKGPHELNVKDFKGIHIKLDKKCKLKFNGQSYDSVIDNCIKKAPILSLNKNKLFVKNVPINCSINLRKRIPKAHIPEENIIVNNQINFIPLPETKCRHPLFGINYKKATKISSSINERLNNTATESSNKEKRKKHKKEKRKVEIDSEVEMKPQTEELPVFSAKKKRKRKSSTNDEHSAKKAKYIKNEPDSTDVWDSEQAIEKNLFDF